MFFTRRTRPFDRLGPQEASIPARKMQLVSLRTGCRHSGCDLAALVMARLFHSVTFTMLVLLLAPQWAAAQDRLCDTGLEDCRQPILDLINREPASGGIDVAFWF